MTPYDRCHAVPTKLRVSSRLGERLKAETRTLHSEAERSPFMSALLRGRMNRDAYLALLHNLHAIYAALEPALQRHAAHPAIALFHLASLARTRSLRDDMAVLQEDQDPFAPDRLEPACTGYVRRLHALDSASPGLLIAHAYVRYLGDLSGGQLLRSIVARSLHLPPGVGTAFYDFGDAAATAALTRAFRAAMERAVVDDEDELVAEAKRGFEWHRQLFDELAMRFAIEAWDQNP